MMGPLLSTFTPDMGLLRSMEIKSAVNRFMTNMYLVFLDFTSLLKIILNSLGDLFSCLTSESNPASSRLNSEFSSVDYK